MLLYSNLIYSAEAAVTSNPAKVWSFKRLSTLGPRELFNRYAFGHASLGVTKTSKRTKVKYCIHELGLGHVSISSLGISLTHVTDSFHLCLMAILSRTRWLQGCLNIDYLGIKTLSHDNGCMPWSGLGLKHMFVDIYQHFDWPYWVQHWLLFLIGHLSTFSNPPFNLFYDSLGSRKPSRQRGKRSLSFASALNDLQHQHSSDRREWNNHT